MRSVVDTFLNLVKIDSPSGEEQDIKKYVYHEASLLDIELEEDKEGNFYSYIGGKGEPVVVCAHLDTVEPGRKIEPIIENGIIKSKSDTILGADNKAALAAMLFALASIKKRRSIELIFSVREETDSGIKGFNFKRLKSKTGLIADTSSPLGNMVIQAPYLTDFKIKIKGRAAHSSEPEKGINALTTAVNILNKIKTGKVDKDTTINVGLINGGEAINTIPRVVMIKGEVRGFNKEKFDANLEKLGIITKEEAKKSKAEYEFNLFPYCSGYKLNKNSSAVVSTIRLLESKGILPNFEISFGGSDANVLVNHGINVVNMGDGAKEGHTRRESISVKNLERLADLFKAYISA